jgi:hypothetical protein
MASRSMSGQRREGIAQPAPHRPGKARRERDGPQSRSRYSTVKMATEMISMAPKSQGAAARMGRTVSRISAATFSTMRPRMKPFEAPLAVMLAQGAGALSGQRVQAGVPWGRPLLSRGGRLYIAIIAGQGRRHLDTPACRRPTLNGTRLSADHRDRHRGDPPQAAHVRRVTFLQQAINSRLAPGVSDLVLNPDAHCGYGAPVGCVLVRRRTSIPARSAWTSSAR